MRAIGLIQAKDIVIGVKGLHINRAVRRIGHRINTETRAACMDKIGNFADRIDRPQNVRHMGHTDKLGAVGHQRFKICQIKLHLIAIKWPELDLDPGILQAIPWANVGFMVGNGDNDFIALGKLAGHGLCQILQQRRGRTAKDDFFGAAGIDQMHRTGACF